MKAAVVQKVGQLVVQEVPMPECGEYGALCELVYGATCVGTDRHLIEGHPPFSEWVSPPFILGHESIGRVLEVGSKVAYLSEGDLVTRVGCPAGKTIGSGWGGFAEYGVALDWRAMEADGVEPTAWRGARVNQVVPAGTDPAGATMFITWRETLSYLRRMGLHEGASILVLGSGANGLSFTAHATHLGAAHRVMIGSAGREKTANRAGATAYIDYREEDVAEKALCQQPDGFDFVLDAIGKTSVANLGLSLMKPGGRIGIYGMDEAGSIHLSPDAGLGTFTVSNEGYDEAETHEEIVALAGEGKLDATIWLDQENPFALTEIVEAFQATRSREVVKALVRLKDRE
ncbi:MAG: zinc-binding dehydrogenase [Gemmatimonadetes bacterium]|nr:zinc-binding dehydrogenase [Gemmatimonadota bacterium]MBT7863090.1 zinc-binding dehydrogenase [Gemmatimonadota bacterium]